jgi:hypothetical protein
VEDFDGSRAQSQFTFERVAFWVRMIDLPLACMGRILEERLEPLWGWLK